MIYAKNNDSAFSFTLNEVPHLISIGKEDSHPFNSIRAPHSHEFLEILLIRSGVAVHVIDNKEYYTSAGDIIVNNAGSIHSRTMGDKIEIYSCFMDSVCFTGLKKNTLVPKSFLPVIYEMSDFKELVSLNQMMYQNTMNGTAEGAEIANYLARAYLVRLRQAIAEQGSREELESKTNESNELASSIKDFLDQNYSDESLCLDTAAEKLHISTYHLSHVFKAIYKISPMRYVSARRMGDAQTMLESTDLTVTEIAMRTGFSNTNQFHHAFAKIMGTSPGQYRKYRKDSARN